jgi:stearoyl-CoA desaturase (delta-9 desaturase)
LLINILFFIGLLILPFNVLILYGILLGWLLSVIGANLVAHRWVTHKHFYIKSNLLKHVFLIIYNLNLIGSIIVYASQHILHHRYTGDHEKDPHSPDRQGFLKTHFRFYGERNFKISLKYFRKLYNTPILRFYHDFYWAPLIVYSLFLILFFPVGYFYYFLITPLFVTFHLSQAQVTLTHMKIFGSYQNFTDTEQSKTSYNNWLLKPFMLGEELHNNHHRYPGRPNQGLSSSIKDYDILYHVFVKRFKRKNHEILP